MKHQIGVRCIGLLASILFLAGLLLPIVVVGGPVGVVALWDSTGYRSSLLIFLTLVVLPLVRPARHVWILSLLGAGIVIAWVSWEFLHRNDVLIPFTLLVLLCAGICLAVEALLVRRYALTRSSELPPADAAGSRSP